MDAAMMLRHSIGTLAMVFATCAASPAQRPPAPAGNLDADGVVMLLPSAPGVSFRLGAGDPNATDGFEIERHTRAVRGREGAVAFWTVAAHPLDYASGGSGLTVRLHVRSGPQPQRFTWRTQHGYLSAPGDLRNQEFTAYVRVRGISDEARAAIAMKVRGGAHTDRDPDQASCVMLTFQAATTGATTRFGKELTHPLYDYVRLAPHLPAALVANRWFALKVVSYAEPPAPGQPARVVNRLYLDDDPWTAAGRPRNGWRLMSEHVDVEGASTGRYTKLVDWGAWITTLRTDGIETLDFAILSAREVAPP